MTHERFTCTHSTAAAAVEWVQFFEAQSITQRALAVEDIMAENKIRRGLSRDEMVSLIASGEAFGGTYNYASDTYTVYLV